MLGAYRRGIIPLPAPDEYFRTINEFRYEDLVADGTIGLVGASRRPVPGGVVVARSEAGDRGRPGPSRPERPEAAAPDDMRTTADTAFGRVAEECRAGREPRWLTDTLLSALAELHAGGWAHSIEVWLDGDLAGGAIGIGIGGIISGDSLFGRHQGAAAIAVADMAARLEAAGGVLIDAQWDSPFLRSLGAEPVPRERYLPLLASSGGADRASR